MEITIILMEYLLILMSLGVYKYFVSLVFDTVFSPRVVIEQNDRIVQSEYSLCMLLSMLGIVSAYSILLIWN